MITTRGFEVQNMPRFTPVDPELVTLNPNRITAGILDTLKIADALKRQQAFKALQEELDATRSARIGAQNAAATLGQATDTRALENVDVLAGLQGATAKSKMQLLQPQTDAAIAEANRISTLVPEQTKNDLSNIQFQESQRPTLETIAREGNQAIVDSLPAKNLATVAKARQELEAAKLATAKATDDLLSLPEDSARKDALENAKIREQNALAKNYEAQAQLALQKPSMEQQKTAARYASIDNHQKTYNALSQDFGRQSTALRNLENTAVTNPLAPNGPKIAASQLADMLVAAGDHGAIWKMLHDPKVMTPDNKRILEELASKRAEVKELGTGLSQISKRMMETLNEGNQTSSSPKIFKTEAEAQAAEDAGLLRIDDQVIIGGVKGTWTK